MASSLVAQLTRIRTHGANPLDLKAQKKAHSQSLLFDARIAAIQDFDTIFWICNEGFQDLCRLDSRFADFAQSIFSEQSKEADRTQMTALQNSQLDNNLNRFLGMVSSKLLLKPALKAIEWLVRRFRIHENNTICLVLTFLPYHLSSIFPTLLSILPGSLPQTLRFLYPYIEALTVPPRHAIVYTASRNISFLTNFNRHVLDLCRSGYHFPALCSFWATIITESVVVALDQSRSGRHQVQKESQEDLILRIMPILNEGLAMDTVPDLQVGCYMVLTVLVTKVSLSDIVLNAAMEAVVTNWSQTTSPGLICLATLAQQRETAALPSKVLRALLALEKLEDDLLLLKTQYGVDNIALGVLLGLLERLGQSQDSRYLGLVRSLLDSELMESSKITIAIAAIFSKVQNSKTNVGARNFLSNLLCCLAEKKRTEAIIKTAAKQHGSDILHPKEGVQRLLATGNNNNGFKREVAHREASKIISDTESFEIAISQIPENSSDETSFLAHSSSDVLFNYLASLFIQACAATDKLEIFSNLPLLHMPQSEAEPLFLSFFVRFWCSSAPATARAIAIKSTSNYLSSKKPEQDLQVLFPYVIYGLADSSLDVRRASTQLAITLGSVYRDRGKEANAFNTTAFGREHIYGYDRNASSATWLSTDMAAKFVEHVLLTDLEESLLDPDHISKHLSSLLKGSRSLQGSENGLKELKNSSKQAFFRFVCGHTTDTSLYRARYRLLKILCQTERVGPLSRTKLLLPLLLEYKDQAEEDLKDRCSKDEIEPSRLLEQVVEIVLPTDREGIQILLTIIEAEKEHQPTPLCHAAISRLHKMWPSIKQDLQLSVSSILFELAVGKPALESSEMLKDKAIETLRTIRLSTSILQFFLEACLELLGENRHDTDAPKRRRTSRGFSSVYNTTPHKPDFVLRRLTTALELVEVSKPEKHLGLMKGLFQILAELQNSRSRFGTEMGYLQVVVLESIHAMVKEFERSTVPKLDKSTIRPDVIVESIRTTTSVQVQHVALLLISGLATISPESVLHSIMPVFTFMGAGILRQDDEYSVYVVNRIMESVIPRLAISLQKQKQDPMVGISELLVSFVAAFPHIPIQRRLELFKSLADKLGPTDYLFALLVILIEKHSSDQKTLEFAAELASLYSIRTQFQTIENYLGVITDILIPKPSVSEHLVSVETRRNSAVAVANLLPLITIILKKKRLVSKTRELLDQEVDTGTSVRVLYERVMETVFLLSGNLRHDRGLDALCQQVLDSLLLLPPVSEFTRIIQRLLTHTKTQVRLDVLKSFQQRLNGNLSDQEATQQSSLAVLPLLLSILEQSANLALKQAALNSVDLVVERFGKQDLPSAFAAAKIVLGTEILGACDRSLQVAALLCLASMVEVLKDMFTPLVPSVFPKSLDYLRASMRVGKEDYRLHNAAYSFTGALLSSAPWIFTDFYLEQLLSVSCESANSGMGKECDQTRVDTLRVLARQVDPHLIFAALGRTWGTAMKNGLTAVKEHLEVLRVAVDQQPKSSIVECSNLLTGIFIECFDLRRLQFSLDTEGIFTNSEVEEIEQIIFDTAIVMIYKLSDATFRPMFRKIWGWSSRSVSDANTKVKIYRQTTLYTFLGLFFSNLKSIVTSYAGLIIEDSVKILQSVNLADEESIVLRKRVVIALHKAFEHDQDDFWQSPSHFSPIAESLLSQFDHAAEIPVATEVIPALTELVVVADSTSHHKQLNSAILRYMRSDKAAIRLAAIQCEQSLTDRLGEEWLAHLPAMLPFISELQEDDDELVEQATHTWIRKIESILGESVKPMLQ